MIEQVSVAELHMRSPQANACPELAVPPPPHPSVHPANRTANVKRMRRVGNGTWHVVNRTASAPAKRTKVPPSFAPPSA